MNKKVEREKKQLRIRSLKQTMKKSNDDYIEDVHDRFNMKVSRLHNLKTQKSIDFNKNERERASLKQAANITLKPEINKTDVSHAEFNMNRRESHSVEPLREVLGGDTNSIISWGIGLIEK